MRASSQVYERPGDHRLPAWSYGTFHAVLFVLAPLLVIYRSGALGDALGNLNTLAGLAIFGALWVTSWWTTRQAVRALDLSAINHRIALGTLMSTGWQWAGVNGALFLGTLTAGAGLLALFAGDPQFAVLIVVFGVLGIPFAVIFGFAFGVFFVALDAVILEISRRLAVRCAPAP